MGSLSGCRTLQTFPILNSSSDTFFKAHSNDKALMDEKRGPKAISINTDSNRVTLSSISTVLATTRPGEKSPSRRYSSAGSLASPRSTASSPSYETPASPINIPNPITEIYQDSETPLQNDSRRGSKFQSRIYNISSPKLGKKMSNSTHKLSGSPLSLDTRSESKSTDDKIAPSTPKQNSIDPFLFDINRRLSLLNKESSSSNPNIEFKSQKIPMKKASNASGILYPQYALSPSVSISNFGKNKMHESETSNFYLVDDKFLDFDIKSTLIEQLTRMKERADIGLHYIIESKNFNTSAPNTAKKFDNLREKVPGKITENNIHSTSWPPSIFASPNDILITRIDYVAKLILNTPVQVFINSSVAADFMKTLQDLMEQQRRMVVGNSEADDFLAKLTFLMAPVSRIAESLVIYTLI